MNALADWLLVHLRQHAQHPALTLSALCLLLWLPGIFSLPPMDRDESRFASASRQMLETGNFVDIRFGHEVRYKKPVGIYWLQAATTAVAGLGDWNHIWTYRLASLIGGLLAVWLTFWCTRALAPPETAWLAAALLGSSVLLTAEATIATTDAVQCACVVGALGVMLRVYRAVRDPSQPMPSARLVYLGWAAFAAGILVKGPIIFVAAVVVAALVAWDREWRWLKQLRPLAGFAITLLIVAPWAIAIAIASHGRFYELALGQDLGPKVVGGQESHGAAPGYYLLLSAIAFWPAILFVLPALANAWQRRTEPAVRFLLVWAGATWVLFELVPTKLPHYVLPAYPALAMLAALWLFAPRPLERWARAWRYVSAAQYAIGLTALAVAIPLLPRLYGTGSSWWLYPLALIGAGLGLAALVAYLRDLRVFALGMAVLGALILFPTLTLGVVPQLEQIWVSPRLAGLVAKDQRPGDPPVAAAGYTEPSLLFLLGAQTRLTDGAGAADAGVYQSGLALIEDHQRPAFLARLGDLQLDAAKVDELSGLNYSRGKKVHVTVYRITAPTDFAPPPAE